MTNVLPFISKAQRKQIERDLFLSEYLKNHVGNHTLISMARMLPGLYSFEFHASYNKPAVSIKNADLQTVMNEIERRNLTT